MFKKGRGMFDWDDHNIDHIARHGFYPEDAEEALSDPERITAGTYNAPVEPRWSIIGATYGGRIVRVVYTLRGSKFRVVMVRDATDSEKRRYRR